VTYLPLTFLIIGLVFAGVYFYIDIREEGWPTKEKFKQMAIEIAIIFFLLGLTVFLILMGSKGVDF
jgi:hypothetical protein